MTASVITDISRDLDASSVGDLRYIVSLKGKPEPRLKVSRFQHEDGAIMVIVEAPKVNGKPIVAVSTMDAIARRVEATARAGAGINGSARVQRRYFLTA
jgi:hypothetical protein